MQEIMQFASRHAILSGVWVVLFMLTIVISFKRIFSKVEVISCCKTIHLINNVKAVVVDVRSSEDYQKGHIFGALNVVEDEIKKGRFGPLDKHKFQPIIVVCATGQNARTLAEKLSADGFSQVNILKDGIRGWSGENLPLVRSK
ncbi:rhodanese-like domain-containing protein [Pantoea sp. Nvir]|uniref:rhodanese-like domain-containing protein n=1 Tax=Pantoea sp. Nvir TaxID=2576760 RepID=UPI0027F4DE91|nr:rhodanese-like domain-containing protein [Pantoea sp. Nvir]CAJ0992642.1 putative protein YibN [Pantoea sp. Nvir]